MATGLVEPHLRSQASNLFSVLRRYVGQHGVFARRDLPRQADFLGESSLTLVQWAFEINVLDLVAQIGLLVYQCDQSVFDLKVNFGTSVDGFGEVAARGDDECLASIQRCVSSDVHTFDVRREG